MARYSNINIIREVKSQGENQTSTPIGKRIYPIVKYPEIPRDFNDLYVYTTAGDRYDTLANQYYQDPSLWWIISIANGTLKQNSLTPPIGTQIRIPSNPSPIISSFNQLNENLGL